MPRAITAGILVVLWRLSFSQHLGDEAIYTINGKKAVHTVSDKFLSISIDPAVLLTGLNLSETTLQLAKHLSPAYIRIAGPSTQFVKYQTENSNEAENGNVVVTPTMWYGINEWLVMANLTPVFGINDRETSGEGWNPEENMDLLHISDKFNISCYWQLGYDCSNKTEAQYKNDLKRFQHILDAFPDHKNSWKIVGSDLSRCIHEPRKVLEDLHGDLAAVIWKPTNNGESLNDFHVKPKIPVWTVAPKSQRPASFASAISWVKQMGEAAKVGYEVILRQPRLREIFYESPPFWTSVLHKKLMGRNVLDVRGNINNPDVSLYAHCTKHQNNFLRSGAMTVLMVNNATTNHTVLVKFGTILFKNTEVQSYILTAPNEKATDVYLNGEELSMNSFVGDRINILPKLRRARVLNYLSLSLPAKSIGFFVLPSAQIPACTNEDADLKLVMDEINEDQNIELPTEEISVDLAPRHATHKRPNLRELKEMMEKELESDERFYRPLNSNKRSQSKDDRTLLLDKLRHNNMKKDTKPKQDDKPKRILELELTSGEIRKVLTDRAKVKASKKNIIFTSEELEEIMDKATDKFLHNKNTAIRIKKKVKREAAREKKDINMRLLKLRDRSGRRSVLREILNRRNKNQQKRERRDINLDLLKIKVDKLQKRNKKLRTNFNNNEEKIATLRESGQVSGEIKLQDDIADDEDYDNLPNRDVFAQLLNPEENLFTTTEKTKFGLKPKTLFNLYKPKVDVKPLEFEPKENVHANDFELIAPPNQGGVELDCIHEYFGKVVPRARVDTNVSELWEIGLESKKQEASGDPPSMTNRGSSAEGGQTKLPDEKINLDEYSDLEEDGKALIDYEYKDLESSESRVKRSTNAPKTNEKLYYMLGLDPKKLKVDDARKNKQLKMLKEWFVNKKKLKFLNKNNEMIHKLATRSADETNRFNHRYKSLTEGLKVWRPADILTLTKTDKERSKRAAENYMNSVENEIGNFMNEIAKDKTIIQPKLDSENGDYQLVFPNKDKIEVVGNNGDTELKLVLHGEPTNEVKLKTERNTHEENTTHSNIQKIPKKEMNDVWDQLFVKLTKFFQGIGTKLKKYIIEDLIKF